MPVAEQKRALAEATAQAAAPAPVAGKSEAEALAYLKDQKTKRDRVHARIADLQGSAKPSFRKRPRRTPSTRRSWAH